MRRRQVQTFAISHVGHTAVYHKWTQTDTAKLDIMIQRIYKSTLVLNEFTNTERRLIHNMVDELFEAHF